MSIILAIPLAVVGLLVLLDGGRSLERRRS